MQFKHWFFNCSGLIRTENRVMQGKANEYMKTNNTKCINTNSSILNSLNRLNGRCVEHRSHYHSVFFFFFKCDVSGLLFLFVPLSVRHVHSEDNIIHVCAVRTILFNRSTEYTDPKQEKK